MEKLKIPQNPKGLLEHLCFVMEQLRMNKISVDEAKAQASLSKQANNIFKHELDKARLVKNLEIKLPDFV